MANRISMNPAEAGQYEWQQPGFAPVSIRYNELLHSLRVQSGPERRVYLAESAHFPASKVSLYSEYGLAVGSCTFEDTRQPRGTLKIEGQKYRFRTENGRLLVSTPDADHSFPWDLPPDINREALAGILLTLVRQPPLSSPI
ncbi:MAG: hypothetical protein EOO08_01110 [Chitinophagaceae bacterium]|nr:MAG: hypothetical protein EOO08_01110 [Chitinophagaceae bacterium]